MYHNSILVNLPNKTFNIFGTVQYKYTKYFFYLLMGLTLFSCVGEEGSSFFKPKRVSPPSIEDRVSLSRSENLGRASWQQPTFIVGQLGELEGKTVADIGSGTGYFTFHLAHLCKKVIAIDIDQEMLDYIDTYKSDKPNIETRLAKPNDPMLEIGEIDKALIVNTIGFIEDRQEYLSTLRPGIAKGGTLVISDFKAPDIHVPSPSLDRIVSASRLKEDLSKAGYINITIDDSTLRYQYVITATVPN